MESPPKRRKKGSTFWLDIPVTLTGEDEKANEKTDSA
jgi:hypothetical protein